MSLDGEIVMDRQADAEEVAAVEGMFREAGFSGPVRAEIEHRGLGEIPFVIYISAPVMAFLTAFAGAAGKDAYGSLREFLKALRAARRDRSGSVVIRDAEGRDDLTVLVLSSDLPEEAFSALAHLDLKANKGAYLVWDRAGSRGWHDPTAR